MLQDNKEYKLRMENEPSTLYYNVRITATSLLETSKQTNKQTLAFVTHLHHSETLSIEVNIGTSSLIQSEDMFRHFDTGFGPPEHMPQL